MMRVLACRSQLVQRLGRGPARPEAREPRPDRLEHGVRERLGWVWGSLGLLVMGGVIAYAIASTRKKELHDNDA